MISTQFDFGSSPDVLLGMPIKIDKNIAAGERIKALIKENGYSQKQLALKLGYKSASTLSKQCSGENLPRGDELERMAELLHTTTDYILSGKKEPAYHHMPTFVVEKAKKEEPARESETEDMTRMDKIVETLQRQVESFQRQVENLMAHTESQSKTISELNNTILQLASDNAFLKNKLIDYEKTPQSSHHMPKKAVNGDPGE